jgi:hypothetical protein
MEKEKQKTVLKNKHTQKPTLPEPLAEEKSRLPIDKKNGQQLSQEELKKMNAKLFNIIDIFTHLKRHEKVDYYWLLKESKIETILLDHFCMLIDNGADINAREYGAESHTLLTKAMNKGIYEIVELLVGKGADINAKGEGVCLMLELWPIR